MNNFKYFHCNSNMEIKIEDYPIPASIMSKNIVALNQIGNLKSENWDFLESQQRKSDYNSFLLI